LVLPAISCCDSPNDGKVESKWVILNEGNELGAFKIAFADSLYGWAIRMGVLTFTYWRTEDGGRSWALDSVPLHSHLFEFRDLAFVSRSNVWMTGILGIMYHTLDGGQSWAIDDQFSGSPGDVQNIATVIFPDSSHGWIAFNWNIARTSDGGLTWQVICSELWPLQALDSNVVFAGDMVYTKLFRTVDGGATWQEIYPGTPYGRSGAQVSFISETEGWAVIGWRTEYTSGGCLIHTRDGGVTWDTLLNSSNNAYSDIHMLPSREGWVIAPGGKTILRTVDGATWREDPLPDIGDRLLDNLVVLPGPDVWVLAEGLVLKRQGA